VYRVTDLKGSVSGGTVSQSLSQTESTPVRAREDSCTGFGIEMRDPIRNLPYSGECELRAGKVRLEEVDRKLLNRMQSGFPVSARPFLEIGNELGLTEAEVLARVSRLKELGVIRRIGANVNPRSIGFVSTLCAAHVPEERVAKFVDTVNKYAGVTHNYSREHYFNVWFTFIAESFEDIEKNLETISRRTHIKDILNMPATKVFKIKAEFEL